MREALTMFNVILFAVLFFGWVFTYISQQKQINKLQDRLIQQQDKFIYDTVIKLYTKRKEN